VNQGKSQPTARETLARMRTETARVIGSCVESQTELGATVERTRAVMRSSKDLLERVRQWKLDK
jgi:hypothetical protein